MWPTCKLAPGAMLVEKTPPMAFALAEFALCLTSAHPRVRDHLTRQFRARRSGANTVTRSETRAACTWVRHAGFASTLIRSAFECHEARMEYSTRSVSRARTHPYAPAPRATSAPDAFHIILYQQQGQCSIHGVSYPGFVTI